MASAAAHDHADADADNDHYRHRRASSHEHHERRGTTSLQDQSTCRWRHEHWYWPRSGLDRRGTRRPLATWQLWHPPQLLMHLARPPTPVRCPSPAMSRACRPLILPLGPSRAPLLSTQQMVADEQLAGWGGQWGVSAGEQVGRLVGWGGSGCRGIARGPQAPVELCCCLCLRLAASATLLVCCLCSTTQSCASKSGMVHTHSGMPS